MYDKFAEDVDAFNINDVKTTESFSITSEGNIGTCSRVPDFYGKVTGASTRGTDSGDALRDSLSKFVECLGNNSIVRYSY